MIQETRIKHLIACIHKFSSGLIYCFIIYCIIIYAERRGAKQRDDISKLNANLAISQSICGQLNNTILSTFL